MSETEVIIRLTLVTLLGAYLVFKHWQREKQEALAHRIEPDLAEWNGTAFDAKAFREAMAESPVDMVESARLRGQHDFRRDERIGAARSRMLRLGWFRHRVPEEAAEAAEARAA